MRATCDKCPVIAASTRCRSRLGKMSASRWASAAGVAVGAPLATTGRSPAARTISIGTDGHEVITTDSSPCAMGPAPGDEFSKAAVRVAMALVTLSLSDDAVCVKLLDAVDAVSEPVAVDEGVVLPD